MNIQEYQIYCEDFFKQGSFQSEETLNQEIAHLSATEFQEWNHTMINAYDKKYDVVRAIIKEIRDKNHFDIKSVDVDWDKDPIKQEDNRVVVKTYQNVYNDVFDKEIKKYQIYLQKTTELQEYIKQKHYQDSLKVTVEDKDFVAEDIIDIYWCGWECDDKAWLVNDNGQKKVVASNHGQKYFADKSFLEEKIKEYEDAIAKTKAMLNQL